MPRTRSSRRISQRNVVYSDDDDDCFLYDIQTSAENQRRKPSRGRKRSSRNQPLSSATRVNESNNNAAGSNQSNPAPFLTVIDILDTTGECPSPQTCSYVSDSEVLAIDEPCREKQVDLESQKENINGNEDKIAPLSGFDPTITFSDSDSDDLYSVSYSNIKASALEAANKKLSEYKEQSNFTSNPSDIEKSTNNKRKKDDEQKETPDETYLSSDDGVRSDSYLSSPDINDIKLSARKLLRVSKKTQQMLDKAEKIGVQIDKDAQNIDESVDYDSDSVILADDDDTISVRVRYGLSVSKISIKKKQQFGYLYSRVAEEHGVNFSQVVLSLRDVVLAPEQTPAEVRLAFADFVECGIIGESTNKSPSDGPSNASSVKLKFQCSERRGTVCLDVNKFEKMSHAMKKYASEKGLDVSKLKFMLDGEKLDASSTPEELDLEGGECIDVYSVK